MAFMIEQRFFTHKSARTVRNRCLSYRSAEAARVAHNKRSSLNATSICPARRPSIVDVATAAAAL